MSQHSVESPRPQPGRAHARWRARAIALRARVRAIRTRLAPVLPALRLAGFVVAVAIVVAMGVGAAHDVHVRHLTWWPLPSATIAAAVWWLLLGRGWALLLSGRPARGDVGTWCRTQALRYLPGGIWAPASRGALMTGGSLDRLSTVAAENVLVLCAALALGGLALAIGGEPWWLPLTLVIAVPVVASRYTARRTRIEPQRTLRATGNYVIAFVAYLIAAALVQWSVSGLHDPFSVAGAAAVAWGVGLVVVIAPSGVGVREVVYVWLLSGSYRHAELVAGALTLRVVTIVAELAVLLVAGRPSWRRARRAEVALRARSEPSPRRVS